MSITCGQCEQRAEGLVENKDFHGNTFALVCLNCTKENQKALYQVYSRHGGIHDPKRKIYASPKGTPHIENVAHLLKIVASYQ